MEWEHSMGDVASKYHVPAEMLKRLGKARDVDLAEEYEVPVQEVGRLRRQLGVQPFRIVDLMAPLLGKMPDTALARRLGCSLRHVRLTRIKAGIPKCNLKQFNDNQRLRAYIDAVKEQ